MTISIVYLTLVLLISSNSLDAHPAEYSEDADDADTDTVTDTWFLGDLNDGNDLEARRDEALEKLQEVLGIRSHTEKIGRRKVPPQFMMELYNNIADPSGVTRGRNPYNAKVVRSFIERDTSMSQFYFFNVSGLETNESVLEAELHLYRKRTPIKSMHPSTFASPYYLIRVYQVLEERSLDVPDLHRLLNIRYVSAHASGWQIFNVKQAVLGWLSGEPNLGILVTASTLFEDQATVEFSRRSEFHHSKQPILVLFDDDGKAHLKGKKATPRYYAYGQGDESEGNLSYVEGEDKIDLANEYGDEHLKRHKRQRGELEEARWGIKNGARFFEREKRTRAKRASVEQATEMNEKGARTLSRGNYRDRVNTVIRSSDIYERASLRERRSESVRRRMMYRERTGDTNIQQRERRAVKSHGTVKANTTECTKHELYVDFKEIGLSSSIIAPVGYSAYHCKGICESPLSQDQQPTNHATIQGIVHKMGLVRDVERPCCVPTKLLGTTILYFDDNENVVLKVYQDMIADRCGCR